MRTSSLFAAVLTASLAVFAAHAQPAQPAQTPGRFTDAPHRAKALNLIASAERYLRSRQDAGTGGWCIPAAPHGDKPASPHMPGITGLVLKGLFMDPRADPNTDPALGKAVDYLLRFRQSDGGIYDRVLPSYNTSLALSALAKANTSKSREAIKPAQDFLRRLQWSEDSDPTAGADEAAKPVTKEHLFYGGVGYGRHGRPDNSNLTMFLQAMEDSGVSPQDEAVQRALVFLQRTQMDDRVNDMPWAKGSRQGGLIYATAENAQSVDGRIGQSQAGAIEETLSDGTVASRLRAYGSMTYAGFKSYLYAELPKDDPRVDAAYAWIRRNYTVDENPGLGSSGQYYYYLVFARAMSSWRSPVIALLNEKGHPTGEERRWAHDLIDKLATLQNPDGSFKSLDKRWMEDNPDLITAYALIALGHAAQ